MDSQTVGIIVTAICTPAGVTLGWYLGRKTARETAQEERAFVERQTVRDRQESAAARLDRGVMAAFEDASLGVVPNRQAAHEVSLARKKLLDAWSRSIVLTDPEIDERVRALDLALLIAFQRGGGDDEQVNLWSINVAIRDVRKALGAFQRRENPPPREFPDPDTLLRLSREGDKGLIGISDWLDGAQRELSAVLPNPLPT